MQMHKRPSPKRAPVVSTGAVQYTQLALERNVCNLCFYLFYSLFYFELM